jgi:hypothetical protein
MNQNARALKVFDNLAQATGLSECAKTALIQLVNPFADFELPKCGYFDTDESASIVQCVKFSTTISVPSTVAPGANWDCHIFTMPTVNPTSNLHDSVLIGGICLVNAAVVNTGNIGGVTVISGPVGSDLSINGAAQSATVVSTSTALSPAFSQSSAATGYLDGMCRVIGMGFEVHNTTSPLNVQGAVAVYRKPQPRFLDARTTAHMCELLAGTVLVPTNMADEGDSPIIRMDDVPSSLAATMLLTGSRQWEARDGCMVVPTLNDQDISVERIGSIIPVVSGVKGAFNYTGVADGALTFSGNRSTSCFQAAPGFVPKIDVAAAVPGRRWLINRQHISNFNTSGAYFTGLSNTTTLVVNSIYYIERFPTQFDGDLVVLANPSPPYSSVAMNLYPEMLRHLPVGVKVGDNADGDWFFQAVKSVADTIGPFLPAILPAGMGVGAQMLANGASSWASNKLVERNTNVAKKIAKNNSDKQQRPAPRPRKNKAIDWSNPPKPRPAYPKNWAQMSKAERVAWKKAWAWEARGGGA